MSSKETPQSPQPVQSNVTNLPTPHNSTTLPTRGRLPVLYATLDERLNSAVVRQDVAVENLLADQEELAELMETARKNSAERLEQQRKALKEAGLVW